jgi:hypothetical protein
VSKDCLLQYLYNFVPRWESLFLPITRQDSQNVPILMLQMWRRRNFSCGNAERGRHCLCHYARDRCVHPPRRDVEPVEGSRHQNDAKSTMVASFLLLPVMAGQQNVCEAANTPPSRFLDSSRRNTRLVRHKHPSYKHSVAPKYTKTDFLVHSDTISSMELWRWYINITITILDIIFYLKLISTP